MLPYTKKENLNMNGYKSKKDLLARITVNPKVLVGKPTIRGLRISVEQILRALANNVPVYELLEDYPELEVEDIQAVLMYATKLVAEQRILPVENTEKFIMPLPDFDKDGYLPSGIHAASLAEVVERFGTESQARRRQAELLRQVVEADTTDFMNERG